jgi:hypothetical protein
MVSTLCMSMHDKRACSSRVFFNRGRHGQESKEGKENREGSRQEGGKEDFQEKEVTSSTTNRLPPPGPPTSSKDLSPCGHPGVTATDSKAGPLCRCLLLDGPVFVWT